MRSSSETSSPSSGPPRPHVSIQSPQLQDEFLKEHQKRLASWSLTSSPLDSPCSPSSLLDSPVCPSSPVTSSLDSSLSPAPSHSSCSPSQSPSWRSGDSFSTPPLSSPELLSELRSSRTRPLRHVPAKTSLTRVFSGRGRQSSGSSPST
ncbi:proline-rich receptor-like protein kinase PERK2 [Austrofundulus limnaeus]|uniref:Proline-rich receptor-like protein kinase PERK2 n=1 Tax=Austrofundulus limnaeus TaxID=52670 RepID=A0A2I4AJ73_AUSLI|nr:PREDICTED: proline-rich receptor-like protein kinase PERK2 [Austrofundulus limnaeus]